MNDFSRQDIEALKASVDLCELIRSHGIDLKPVGRNFTALCPWHDDKDASFVVNPEKQLYNCFGCEARILETPRVPLLQKWRGEAVDEKASRQLFIGHFDCEEAHHAVRVNQPVF